MMKKNVRWWLVGMVLANVGMLCAQQEIASIQSMLDRQGEISPLMMLGIVFIAGIVTSFTPCIYPMIPITLGILQAQAGASLWHNFLASFFYVTGIAVVYATLGYLSVVTRLMFGQWFANPLFMAFVILFFLYFAGSLFGFYEIYMPRWLQNRSNFSDTHKGSLVQCFLFGLLSGTVASPCLTPALAFVLALAAKSEHPILGFLYLFSFSFGMGTVLMLIGTFSSTLALLPRAGEWMDEVKKLLGFMMLAVTVYLCQSFISPMMVWGLYALISAAAAVYYMVSSRGNKIKYLLGILAIVVTVILGSTSLVVSLR